MIKPPTGHCQYKYQLAFELVTYIYAFMYSNLGKENKFSAWWWLRTNYVSKVFISNFPLGSLLISVRSFQIAFAKTHIPLPMSEKNMTRSLDSGTVSKILQRPTFLKQKSMTRSLDSGTGYLYNSVFLSTCKVCSEAMNLCPNIVPILVCL